MAFIIGLPVAQIILFCWAIGHDPTGLHLAISNHELDNLMLPPQECPVYSGCNYTMMSCRYLEYLKNRSIVIVSNFKEISGMFYNIFPITFRPTISPTRKLLNL